MAQSPKATEDTSGEGGWQVWAQAEFGEQEAGPVIWVNFVLYPWRLPSGEAAEKL